jgi:hypothetical protein
MISAEPSTLLSGVEAVVLFQTDHRNWAGAGVLALHDQASGDYLNVEQTAQEGIVARVKSTAGGGIDVWDTINNEAVFLKVRTPVQLAIEGRPLPAVSQSQPKGAPLKLNHK